MTTRTLIKAILENAGYEVDAAADGAQAWRLVEQKGADLVVADVEMPEMDGFELTRTIRSSVDHGDVPVILLTALETDRDKARGLSAGANAYLLKSAFDQRELLAAIREMV
jgi:two-component system chemotaxis sensor kinase CheA